LYPFSGPADASTSGVNGGETADYVHLARRNNSLSSSGRALVFGFILSVSLGIAVAFSLVFGAWPILSFAGLEMVVLYLAFRYIERHAGDYERITVRGDRVSIEVREAGDTARFDLNRCWAQVVCESEGARLALRSHGREIEVGRHVRDEQRLEMARSLVRELRRL
jgi:uncharacterized membrane protein